MDGGEHENVGAGYHGGGIRVEAEHPEPVAERGPGQFGAQLLLEWALADRHEPEPRFGCRRDRRGREQ